MKIEVLDILKSRHTNALFQVDQINSDFSIDISDLETHEIELYYESLADMINDFEIIDEPWNV